MAVPCVLYPVPSHLPGRQTIAGAAVVAVVLCAAVASGEPFRMVNVTSAFHPGPYTALTVDPQHPETAVVGCADGYAALSHDGGLTAHESRTATPRIYALQQIRGVYGRKREKRTLEGELPDTRYFLWQVNEAELPTGRWEYWMGSDDRTAEVADLAVTSTGRMVAASTFGLLLSDGHQAAWTRVVGTPKAIKQDVTGLSVIFDPRDPTHLLAGTNHGLLVSHNGGYTFGPTDGDLADEQVRRMVWRKETPDRVLAITSEAVYESKDSGESFSELHKLEGQEIRDLAVFGDSIYLATDDGLVIFGPGGEKSERLKEEGLVSVVPLSEGRALAASAQALFLLDGEEQRIVMRTTDTDPFVRLGGNGKMAWAITKYGVFHTGLRPARLDPVRDPPRMRLSLETLQNAVVKRLGLGNFQDTRLADRWYAKLVPKITVRVKGIYEHDNSVTYDGTFPVRYRYLTTGASDQCCGALAGDTDGALVIMATWDLAKIFAGIGNGSTPWGWVETNIRPIKGQVLSEVRWRYREAANLAAILARPPEDPLVALSYRYRLEEHVAYLEALSGRTVITPLPTEEP